MMDYIDRQLGNYRILKLLGHGGFADVYLGEHVYLNTQVAIKVLHTQLDEEDREKFRNEALLIAHLLHPHIIRVLDFGVEEATPFLVMDYAPGGTLRQRVPKRMRLSPMVFMPYVKQIASALQYAHDQKVIHRDIKPENMLLDGEGEVKLSDFGIALVAQSTRSQETESAVIGTMMYMAPEQIQGKARPASDQYSLAVVVYEWLTGEKPFKGSYMEIVTQHLTAPPPPIDEQALSLPHAVTQVIWRAMAKDPHDRFARVQDFADALERAYRNREPIAIGQAVEGVAPLPPPPEREAPAPRLMAQTMVPPPLPPTQIVTPPFRTRRSTMPPFTEARPIAKKALGCTRNALLTLVMIPLLLCGLGFAGYNYFINRNTSTQATAMANDFMHALLNHNYEQAYNDLDSSVAAHDSFIKQAQDEDGCYGQITKYQETGVSSPNGSQVHNYLMTRAKIGQPYHLHVTLGKDFWGNWHITDYNSDIEVGNGACH